MNKRNTGDMVGQGWDEGERGGDEPWLHQLPGRMAGQLL